MPNDTHYYTRAVTCGGLQFDLECKDNFVLHKSRCVKTCPIHYWLNRRNPDGHFSCELCEDDFCLACDGPGKNRCLKCTNKIYTLQNNSCSSPIDFMWPFIYLHGKKRSTRGTASIVTTLRHSPQLIVYLIVGLVLTVTTFTVIVTLLCSRYNSQKLEKCRENCKISFNQNLFCTSKSATDGAYQFSKLEIISDDDDDL